MIAQHQGYQNAFVQFNTASILKVLGSSIDICALERNSSDVLPLYTGAPQGSSLGPFLFLLYIAPLSAVINSFGVSHHQHADDTQIYITVSRADVSDKVDLLQDCTAGVHSWLLMNGLQLNPVKSEVIQFTATRGRDKVEEVNSVVVSNAIIQPASSIRSLGVTLDRKLSFDQHVKNTCRSCYHHIRALRHIRESLPDEVAKIVACSVIGSRLDYCNALLSGMSKSNFTKLQRVQNTLARVVLRRRKFDQITPALRELHWLPVQYRVTFKTATLVHSIENTGQPAYLRQLLHDYEPVRSLRSLTRNLFCKTVARTVLASRGFRHSAVHVWNNLPDNIRGN